MSGQSQATHSRFRATHHRYLLPAKPEPVTAFGASLCQKLWCSFTVLGYGSVRSSLLPCAALKCVALGIPINYEQLLHRAVEVIKTLAFIK